MQGGHYGNALQVAALWGHAKALELLLENGAQVNVVGGQLGTALQAAAYQGHLGIVEFLLQKGANVREQCGQFHTALQAAAVWGHLAIVQFLIQAGADVNAQGGHFGSAIQEATMNGHQAVVQLLTQHGASLGSQTISDSTVVGHSAAGGPLDTAVTGEGDRLYAAALRGNTAEVRRCLLEDGTDVNCCHSGKGGTPLQAAASKGHDEIVRLLLAHGADIERGGGQWDNPLQAACFSGHVSTVPILLDAGADLHAFPPATHYGDALQAVALWGHRHIVALLLARGTMCKLHVVSLDTLYKQQPCGAMIGPCSCCWIGGPMLRRLAASMDVPSKRRASGDTAAR